MQSSMGQTSMFSGKDVSNIFVNKSYDQSLGETKAKDLYVTDYSKYEPSYKDFYQTTYKENPRPNVDSDNSRNKEPFAYAPHPQSSMAKIHESSKASALSQN